MRRVAVIGGGIAGLATALHLKDRASTVEGGLEIRLLEAGSRLGGNIRTEHGDGFTFERGPNGYLDNVPAMERLVERLQLAPELQKADDAAAKRFLYRNGRLHPLPSCPLEFLRSPILSLGGRVRVCLEPFSRAGPGGVDESVHDFARRRIGAEAADILIDAMVSGIFAGNTRRLSLASAFPKMAAMEDVHGSLFTAMIAQMREHRAARKQQRKSSENEPKAEAETRSGGPTGPGGTLTSFRRGLETLIEHLAEELDGIVRLNHRATAIEPLPAERPDRSDGSRPGWRINADSVDPLEVDAVLIATPAVRAAPMLKGIDPLLGQEVEGIRSAGLVVVALGFESSAIGGPPEGFGFLVPRCQGLRSLGCLWDSSIFPGRAPAGKTLLRAMVGGAHDPEAVELDDEALISVVRQDLEIAMGLTAAPSQVRVFRHPVGIAQYEPGHQARLNLIDERLRELPGLWVAGSSFYGVSMNACVDMAERQAGTILDFLGLRARTNRG
ncbi:MAG: protoporphyrinogen oxidase [Thermoanaerobaculia bacterium]